MEEITRPAEVGPQSASPRPSISTLPLPRRARSLSHSSEFPPPVRRRSTETNRPVPFSSKFQKVHPGTTGVIMLEHLEKLDAVEASLHRLGVDEPLIEEEDEEVDVGESSASHERTSLHIQTEEGSTVSQDLSASATFSPPESPDGVTSLPDDQSFTGSMTEEDLTTMSKSMSHVESPPARHMRWNSHTVRSRQLDNSLDWMAADEAEQRKRTVVVEVSA
jgi:phosphatidylinositol 4-kinase type 2